MEAGPFVRKKKPRWVNNRITVILPASTVKQLFLLTKAYKKPSDEEISPRQWLFSLAIISTLLVTILEIIWQYTTGR
jgi:hypothetical protein